MKQARNININFFKTIDSEIKAYLLGFYLGDGSIHNNRLQVGVSEKDFYIVRLFQEYISPNTKLTYYIPDNFGEKPSYKFQVMSKNLIQPLVELGWGYRKTYLSKNLPDLNEKLFFHFFRGYFDADGNVRVNLQTRKSGRQKGYVTILRTFSLWSYDRTHLKKISEILKKYKIKSFVKTYSKGNNSIGHVLLISSLNSLQILYSKFYSDYSFYLGRKKLMFKKVTGTSSKLRKLKNS